MALDPRWPLALFRGSLPIALGLMLWVAIAGGEQERQETLKVRGHGGGGDALGCRTGRDPSVFPGPAGAARGKRHDFGGAAAPQ